MVNKFFKINIIIYEYSDNNVKNCIYFSFAISLKYDKCERLKKEEIIFELIIL